ncbi:MAG: indole-3-glycerol phosphate synthase TrpC [Bacillota bacterium]
MILEKIVKEKKKYLKTRKFKSYKVKNKFKLSKSLKENSLTIIGELKRSSPSKKNINIDADYKKIVKEYNKSVQGISILTEKKYFNGEIDDLINIRDKTDLPILRKDFIIETSQIYESYILGANVILLIAAILDEKKLSKFINLANALDLECIVEVHNKKELDLALKYNNGIIGINNRNLKTFEIDLETTNRLKKYIPKDISVISESGIKTRNDILKLKKIDGVLIGETFMKSKNIGKKVKELKGLK